MKLYDPLCGESIKNCANEMVELVKADNEPIMAIFNDVVLIASSHTKAEDLIKAFWEGFRKNASIYKLEAVLETSQEFLKALETLFKDDACKFLLPPKVWFAYVKWVDSINKASKAE